MSRRPRIELGVVVRLLASLVATGAGVAAIVIAILLVKGVLS
ncbi:MAG: hypothetical protein ACR2MK_07335 [Solirubrobacteraceae bacterium]